MLEQYLSMLICPVSFFFLILFAAVWVFSLKTVRQSRQKRKLRLNISCQVPSCLCRYPDPRGKGFVCGAQGNINIAPDGSCMNNQVQQKKSPVILYPKETDAPRLSWESIMGRN